MKPDRDALTRDITAGSVLGLVSVPDGLAAGLLAGLNPLAGLYGYLVGTLAGALSTSSVFMCVQATGAMAVVISDVPQVRGQPDSPAALATLGLLTGAIMLLAGVLRLGAMVRFVPNAVLAGFVNAVAINIVLGQLADFTGFASEHGNRVARLVDTLVHPGGWQLQVLATALVTLAVILVLERTRVGALALVVGVVLASALVAVLRLHDVRLVRDIADIPRALPGLQSPALSSVLDLLIPALALAFVGLVQGAAISQSVANPDGAYPDSSGDFRGQGIANLAAGLLRGMPVGGSMSGTALVRAAGARSRVANIVAAAVMAAVILVLAGVAGYIAMPSLAALLMLVGFRTLKPDQVRMVWQTGAAQATVMATTFALTLTIPLQYAVLAGVAISIVLFVVQQSNKVTVIRWTFREGSAYPVERPAPSVLPGGEVVVLAVYGSLFFASAQVVEAQLPRVEPRSAGAVVVLRLRGTEDLGSTFIQTMLRYSATLREAGCELVLAGVGGRVLDQLERTGALAELGPDNVFRATAQIGESLTSALERARALRS
ncbi:MAG TPA: SulP family inorganic anion transporter [Mycobacteriales bacterium]